MYRADTDTDKDTDTDTDTHCTVRYIAQTQTHTQTQTQTQTHNAQCDISGSPQCSQTNASHHPTHYVTSSYILCHIIIRQHSVQSNQCKAEKRQGEKWKKNKKNRKGGGAVKPEATCQVDFCHLKCVCVSLKNISSWWKIFYIRCQVDFCHLRCVCVSLKIFLVDEIFFTYVGVRVSMYLCVCVSLSLYLQLLSM